MNLLYYYYFLFYTKVLPDNEPHATTVFTLSLSEAFLINGVIQILIAHLFCMSFGKWQMITIFLLIIGVNYLLFSKSGKAKEIVKLKPKIFNSNKLSIFIVVLFFVITASFLFWEPIYVKQILEEHCR
jgi:hypothetical protein